MPLSHSPLKCKLDPVTVRLKFLQWLPSAFSYTFLGVADHVIWNLAWAHASSCISHFFSKATSCIYNSGRPRVSLSSVLESECLVTQCVWKELPQAFCLGLDVLTFLISAQPRGPLVPSPSRMSGCTVAQKCTFMSGVMFLIMWRISRIEKEGN